MSLSIRPYVVADEPALSAAIARSLDHLRPWVPFADREPVSRTERLRWIAQCAWERATGGDLNFGIFDEAGELVGGCGLHRRVGPGAFEVGYWVAVERSGTGVASEAVRQLVARAFAIPSITRLEIHHDERNPASGRVAEKNGFTFVRTRPDGANVMKVWELRRPEASSG